MPDNSNADFTLNSLPPPPPPANAEPRKQRFNPPPGGTFAIAAHYRKHALDLSNALLEALEFLLQGRKLAHAQGEIFTLPFDPRRNLRPAFSGWGAEAPVWLFLSLALSCLATAWHGAAVNS